MNPADRELAEDLEELLSEEEAAALDERLAGEPAAAARHAALAALFAERAQLPALDPPPELEAALLARLQAESLVQEGSPDADDELLAAQLEGLLSAEEAAALEARFPHEPELARRADALAVLFEDRARLPVLDPPPELEARVHATLEAAGLLFDPCAQAFADESPAPALFARTMERLEAEGLVAPAAPTGGGGDLGGGPPGGGGLIRFSLGPWRLAAALLAALGLGVLLGPRLSGADAELTRLHAELGAASATLGAERQARSAASVRHDELAQLLAVAVETGAAARGERDAARQEAEQARTQVGQLQEALRARDEQLAQLSGTARELVRAESRAAELERRLAVREDELGELRHRAGQGSALEERLAALEQTVGERDATLRDLRGEQAIAEERLKELSLALDEQRAAAQPVMAIAAARRIERWDPAVAMWRPLEGEAQLAPGAIVRGHGAASSLTVGTLRYELREGLYVVTGARRIEPLPQATPAWSPAPARPAAAAQRVPQLIRLFAGGSPQSRARAQRELTELYYRHPDPGPGVAARLRLNDRPRAEGPPTTAQDWETWWERVAPQLAGR